MTSPVVVSRIQNRRGLQTQFNALYPLGYDGVGGYGSETDFTAFNYPDVLLPGEIAFCTDSRRVFLGNINGEYIEIAHSTDVETDSIELTPVSIALPPSATFAVVSGLDFTPRSFYTINYDLSDSISPDWNSPGTNFSRNGSLQITTVTYIASPPAAVLTDTGTEINNVPPIPPAPPIPAIPRTISFIAEYDATTHTYIQIKYKHNFPSSLTLKTSNFTWVPF